MCVAVLAAYMGQPGVYEHEVLGWLVGSLRLKRYAQPTCIFCMILAYTLYAPRRKTQEPLSETRAGRVDVL